MADKDALGWLNDPTTVNPKDYLPQMVAADNKPGDALKRARAKLDYARKTRQWCDAPPCFPPEHVFTDTFFPWLLKKCPGIQGIHPHYGRKQVSVSVSISWKRAQSPRPAPSPLDAVQQENAMLRREIEKLEAKIASLEQDNTRFRERDAQRRRNCGRRTTEKTNS